MVRCVRGKHAGQLFAKKAVVRGSSATEWAESEIKMLRKLIGLENIVQFVTSYEDQECVNIVMEMADRGDLRHNLDRYNGFQDDCVKHIILKLLIALEFLEYQHIVHRDLKCENVFVTQRGEIKLGDFGLALQLKRNERSTSYGGTLGFMPPDVLQYSPKSQQAD